MKKNKEKNDKCQINVIVYFYSLKFFKICLAIESETDNIGWIIIVCRCKAYDNYKGKIILLETIKH